MVEEKPFLLTMMTVAIGFVGIALTIIGLPAIITSPRSGLGSLIGETELDLLSQLTTGSSVIDIRMGSALFIIGIIVLIAGSGLHQMRMWALQAVMGLFLVAITLCAVYTLLFLGMIDFFDVSEFQSFNGMILPLLLVSIFFFIYLITVRHYFD
ncbi:MAG: hypothetical protein ACE5I5_07590 [Candidatus Heimdallarchaeota archaeon]